jgi:hypothetical protein
LPWRQRGDGASCGAHILPEFDVTNLTFGRFPQSARRKCRGILGSEAGGNVIQRRKWTSNAIVVAALAAVILPAPLALAADAREVEELRNDVRQLQAQVQTLRSAMAELAELDRQQYAAVSRAPNAGPSAPEPRTVPLLDVAETREPTPARVAPASGDKPSRSSKSRRHRHSRTRSKSGRAASSAR